MFQPTAVLCTLQILPLNITEHSALMETLFLLCFKLAVARHRRPTINTKHTPWAKTSKLVVSMYLACAFHLLARTHDMHLAEEEQASMLHADGAS